jgi:molybdopterin-guanine dinucleotide biosynthesis protein A
MPEIVPRSSGVVLGGIFVGGASRRMGQRPKGLLIAPDGRPIVERWCALFRAVGAEPVLVGRHPAYAAIDVPVLADELEGVGPMGGLVALLRHARAERASAAIAVACDMPYVSERLLRALCTDAQPGASVLAPRTEHGWEPLFARYRPELVLEVAIERARSRDTSMQRLLDAVATTPWTLSAAELAELRDWDQPSDVESPR